MSEMSCKNCGSDLIGNGITMALHCETVELPQDVEPDSGPHYCEIEEN